MSLRRALEQSWIRPSWLTLLLLPLSWLYQLVFSLRGRLYQFGLCKSYKASIPVIVVGNLTVGGTGKTPLTIHLVELLRKHGYSPGIISRGYGSLADEYPYHVTQDSPIESSGDEPALIVKRTGAPMMIGANRKDAIESLLAIHPKVDVILSDDGLQHLALERNIEICVIDATSPKQNQYLLPAGPYREPLARLKTVDLVIKHGAKEDKNGEFAMNLQAQLPKLVSDLDREVSVTDAADNHEHISQILDKSQKLQALAGIGNPQRFFTTCRDLGFVFDEHVFSDHHRFVENDINFGESSVLMTEKDAVKCQKFSSAKHWYLPVDAKLSTDFDHRLIVLLKECKEKK